MRPPLFVQVPRDERAARIHFDELSHEEQIAAVCRMADEGHTDYTIAAASRLSVEMIRQILAERVGR